METDSPSTSGRSSPAPAVEKLCPCKATKEEKTTWLQCTNQPCNSAWWHGSCVGFYSRKSTLNQISKKWICPYCCISKLPGCGLSNEKLLLNLSKKMDETKMDLKNEIVGHNLLVYSWIFNKTLQITFFIILFSKKYIKLTFYNYKFFQRCCQSPP